MTFFVLVGGWPGAGKTTLARPLAAELALARLSKDEVKEALMDSLGATHDVQESRRLGRAAVTALLRVAHDCPGAVIDSTWFPYTLPLVRALPAPCVEVRCEVSVELARRRHRSRRRDARHLDDQRSDDELWGSEVATLGVGPLVVVDTSGPVDVPALAREVRRLAGVRGPVG